MGFFSWGCPCCKHSVLNFYSVDRSLDNGWMADAVAVFKNGDIVSGEYDGYGRIGWLDNLADMDNFKLCHQACWEIMGKPSYDELPEDPGCGDQGYFYDDKDYRHSKPRNKGDVEAMAAAPPMGMWD